MTCYLRKVDAIFWEDEKILLERPCCKAFSADVCLHLKTSERKLSVWEVAADRSNIDRIVASNSIFSSEVTAFDYVLLDQAYLQRLRLHAEISTGKSRDVTANDQWHRDIVELSILDINTLAKIIRKKVVKGNVVRLNREEVLRRVAESLQKGFVSKASLNLSKAAWDELNTEYVANLEH